MEQIINELKNRRAILMSNLTEDKGRFSDPFLGQFMRGRVAVEENIIEWIDRMLAEIE